MIYTVLKKMVETKKHIEYVLIHCVLKLGLVLSVAIMVVQRFFSSTKYVKIDLRTRTRDQYITDVRICCIGKKFFANVITENMVERFLNMKAPKEQVQTIFLLCFFHDAVFLLCCFQ